MLTQYFLKIPILQQSLLHILCAIFHVKCSIDLHIYPWTLHTMQLGFFKVGEGREAILVLLPARLSICYSTANSVR